MATSTQWTIRRRLFFAFSSISAITLVLGSVAFYAAVTGQAAVTELGGNRLPSVQALLTISEAQTAVDSAENALLAKNITPALRQEQYKRFDDAQGRFERAWKVYQPLPQTAEEAEVWKKFVPAWGAWWKDHEAYVTMARAYETAPSDEGYEKMSHQALVTIGASFGEAERQLTALVDINQRAGAKSTASAMSTTSSIKIMTMLATLASVGLAVCLGFVITSRLNRILGDRVVELRQGSEQVASASSQVASAAQSLSQGATEQAASLEETSASMEEMASMTRRNAESAGEAASLMGTVDQQVTSANHDLGEMVMAMEAIKDSSSRISKIIKTIDEIAFQTNILALNAAVEAARAGEAGMGFAVVADEVRNLAQRAAAAAKDTAALIDEASGNADTGANRVGRVRDSIAGLTAVVSKVRGIAEEVSTASRQQAQGIDQVTQAITQMEKVTQTTAATSEESAAASEELNAQAENTMAVVGSLAELVHGAGDGAPRESAPPVRHAPAPGRSFRVVRPPTTSASRVVPMRGADRSNDADGTFGSF